MADFQIEGLGPVLAKLKNLSVQMKKKAVRAAAMKAMAVVRKAAQAGAASIDDPLTAENISKNIAVRFDARGSKREGGVVVKVGVRGGAKNYANTKANQRAGKVGKSYATGGSAANPGGDTWYWRLVEFGTSHSAAQPFLRPALESNTQRVTQTMVTELDKAIEKIIAKGVA